MRCSALMLFRALALILFVLVALPFLPAQTIVRSFDGDKGPDQEHCRPEQVRCGRQAEMVAAANGKQVVQVTWQHVNVYDYNGKLLHSTLLPDFIKKAGLDPMPPPPRRAGADVTRGPFEPHIVFDEFIRRWILTVTCLNDCFLVSASEDPAGSWRGVYLSCQQGGPCLNYDPALQLGYDKNGVYYCGAHIGEENPNTMKGAAYDCFAIPPGEVKDIGKGKEPEHLNRKHNMAMHIRPAIDQNPKKARNASALFATRTCSRAKPGGCQNASNFPFEWIVTSFTWDGPTGTYSEDQVVKTDVGSQQDKWLYNFPCCGPKGAVPQAGSDIGVRSTESHRLNNLVQFGSHLELAFSSGPCMQDCGAQGEDKNNIMFWADLDCTNLAACKVAQTAKISGDDVNPFFPSIGVDNKGNVGIIAASSSKTNDLSILLWTHRTTDPANTFNPPITVIAGTQPYTCPNNMNLALIGSAVGMLTVRDPRDGSKLWTTHQYSGDATPCVWDSRIVEYQPGAAANSAQNSPEVYEHWPFDAKEAGRRKAETAKALALRKEVSVDLGKGVPLKLTLIPAGKFMMGSPETETINLPTPGTHRSNESPLHEVTITHPFFISVFKVTQEQYQDVMGSNPSKFAEKDHPVDAVTWEDANLFCQKASARTKRGIHLPTEAEWEYAARAGTDTRYSFGDDETKLGDYAWFHDNAKGKTYPVGQKLANAWGLFDVHGLLWEYTSDFYSKSYADAKSTDPAGPASGTTHSIRAGTYGSKAPFVRSAIQIEGPAPDATKNLLSHFGFRVAMDVNRAQ